MKNKEIIIDGVDVSRCSYYNPQETTILSLIATGKDNSQIAEDLNISETTVKTHVSAIYEKLSITDLRDQVKRLTVALMYQNRDKRTIERGKYENE